MYTFQARVYEGKAHAFNCKRTPIYLHRPGGRRVLPTVYLYHNSMRENREAEVGAWESALEMVVPFWDAAHSPPPTQPQARRLHALTLSTSQTTNILIPKSQMPHHR